MFDAISALLAAIAHQRAGRLREAGGLLRSVLAHDPDEPSALYLLGSNLLALEKPAEAAALLAQAVSLRPDHRDQRLALARALLSAQRPEEALDALAPLAADPALADVQYLRGTALNALQRPTEAVAALLEAVAAAPDHAGAHLNLGNALADLDQTAAAETHMRRAIALAPDLTEAHASLGFLLTSRGALEEAIEACQRAIDLRPDFALAHWNQGIAYLLAGRMTEGWAKYEWRKQRFPGMFTTPPGVQWDGAPLAGRTLLVLAEQGFGDTIMLSRYLAPLTAAGGTVLLECPPVMAPLLRRLPGVTLIHQQRNRPHYDVWCDQMSLPRLLGIAPEDSQGAYLQADPARVAAWAPRLPGGLRIGIAWAGNPNHSNDHRRSIPFEALAPLLDVAPGAFVSLQVGPRAFSATAPWGLTNIAAALTDFGETAAVIAGLDLVIAVDTAVAHLAGALGVPAWVMLPHAPDWRWRLDTETTPWYEGMRLFRQQAPGDWGGVVARVATALAAVAQDRYSIAIPPLTWSVAPVIQPASSEAK